MCRRNCMAHANPLLLPQPKQRRKRLSIASGSSNVSGGPAVLLDKKHLAFESSPRLSVERVVKMINTGTTALTYEWMRRKPPCQLGTITAASAHEVFYISNPAGQLLPGAAVHIQFSFRSVKPVSYEVSPHCPIFSRHSFTCPSLVFLLTWS